MASRVEHATLSVCHMGGNVDEAKGVEKTNSGFSRLILQTEAEHTAAAFGKIFLCQCIILTVLVASIVHPSHLRIVFEEIYDTARVFLHDALYANAVFQCRCSGDKHFGGFGSNRSRVAVGR